MGTAERRGSGAAGPAQPDPHPRARPVTTKYRHARCMMKRLGAYASSLSGWNVYHWHGWDTTDLASSGDAAALKLQDDPYVHLHSHGLGALVRDRHEWSHSPTSGLVRVGIFQAPIFGHQADVIRTTRRGWGFSSLFYDEICVLPSMHGGLRARQQQLMT